MHEINHMGKKEIRKKSKNERKRKIMYETKKECKMGKNEKKCHWQKCKVRKRIKRKNVRHKKKKEKKEEKHWKNKWKR